MKGFARWGALFLSACLIIGVASGCRKSPEVSPATRERQEELTASFVEELKVNLIPARDNEARLKEFGFPVSTLKATYNIGALEEFYETYQQRKNTSVTLIFSTTGFIVTRLVFEGGYGYYMRYQYDPQEGEMLPVANKLIDSVFLARDNDTNRVELVVRKDEAEIASFAFRHLEPAGASRYMTEIEG